MAIAMDTYLLWHYPHFASPKYRIQTCLCSRAMRMRPTPSDKCSSRAVSIFTMDLTVHLPAAAKPASLVSLLLSPLLPLRTVGSNNFRLQTIWCVCKSGHDFAVTASLSLTRSIGRNGSSVLLGLVSNSQIEVVANFVSGFLKTGLQNFAISFSKCSDHNM